MESEQRALTMDRIIRRIQSAIAELDLGLSDTQMKADFLLTINRALRETGSPPLAGLEDRGPLLRAAIALEGAQE